MWDEITFSLANESIESLEIESPWTLKKSKYTTIQLHGSQGGIIDIELTAPPTNPTPKKYPRPGCMYVG